jgi:chromosome segregation ATPase
LDFSAPLCVQYINTELPLCTQVQFDAEVVELWGSFDKYAAPVPLTRNEEGGFWVNLSLPAGNHLIRFLVDGEWEVDTTQDITCSGGNEYNMLVVQDSDPVASASAAVKSVTGSPQKGRKSLDIEAIRAEVVQRERDWRRAWELHTLRDHHLREQAKLKLQTQFKDDREKCLAKIRTYAKESKELRSQAMVLESKLDKASTESQLVTSAYERLKGSHDVQLRYLEEEANKHKTKVHVLEDDLTAAKSSQRAAAAALEAKEAQWRFKEVDAEARALADAHALQQQLANATQSTIDLREQVGALTDARTAAASATQQVEREVVSSREEQRTIREELLKERTNATELRSELSALTVTMNSMENRLTKELTAGKDENIARLGEDLEASRAALISSRAVEVTVRQELTVLRDQLVAEGLAARTEVSQLKARAEEAEVRRLSEATVRGELEAKAVELQRTVGEVRAAVATAEAATRAKDTELAEMQARMVTVGSSGEERERELAEAAIQLRAQVVEAEEARAQEHRTLLESQSANDASLSSLEQAHNQHTLDAATWERERVELRREINDSSATHSRLQGTVLNMQDTCQQLRATLEGMRADQLASLTAYSSILLETQAAAAAHCSKYDGKLEEAQRKYVPVAS